MTMYAPREPNTQSNLSKATTQCQGNTKRLQITEFDMGKYYEIGFLSTGIWGFEMKIRAFIRFIFGL